MKIIAIKYLFLFSLMFFLSCGTELPDNLINYEVNKGNNHNNPENKADSTITNSKSRTIHVAKAGTLSNYISDEGKYTIEELVLTGEINGSDLLLLRSMAGRGWKLNLYNYYTSGKLSYLDLSGVKLVAGGESYCGRRDSEMNYEESYYLTNDDEIPKYVFDDCIRLKTVIVPNNLKNIGLRAFAGCTYLTSISIPNSVTSIGPSAFKGCTNLSSIPIPNGITSIEDYTFDGCEGLISIIIPHGVLSIGESAFRGCKKISTISIPNSVNNIDSFAFSDCNGLKSVNSKIRNPFDLDGSEFGHISLDAILIVPKGSKSSYESKKGWKRNFIEIIESDD